MSEWIKCSDRMPNEYEDVLAWVPFSNCLKPSDYVMPVSMVRGRLISYCGYEELDVTAAATHWMPFPKGPE